MDNWFAEFGNKAGTLAAAAKLVVGRSISLGLDHDAVPKPLIQDLERAIEQFKEVVDRGAQGVEHREDGPH